MKGIPLLTPKGSSKNIIKIKGITMSNHQQKNNKIHQFRGIQTERMSNIRAAYNAVKLMLLMCLGLFAGPSFAAETIPPGANWSLCSTALETCEFDGTKEVAFGVDGAFAYQYHTDGVYCAPSVFGDPLPGKRKYCWTRKDTSHLTPPEGAGWIFCIGERNTCPFEGTYEVAFGRDGLFAYQIHEDGASCTNAVFGDAAPGKYKHCWIRQPVAEEPVAPEGEEWTYCAMEGDTCYLTDYHEVAYGREGAFFYETVYQDVSCSNSVFGDPAAGKSKHCWSRPVEVENSITIDLADPKQEITLMGSDMERSQFYLNNASNSQQISDWVFKDIKFDYSRVSYDRKQELVEGAPNLAFYDRAVLSMKMARESNPNLKFWATLKSDYDGYGTTNNLPDWIYTGGGHNGGSYEPNKLNIEKYARFLTDYLKYMSDNGVAISVMSVVKEWSQVVNAANEVAVIKEIKRLLTTSDYLGVPEPEFSGPSTWGTKQAISILNSYKNQNALGLFKGISTHSYDNATEATWTTLVNNANDVGLSVWHTETGLGTGPTYGVELDIDYPISRLSSRAMFYRSGMEGELFFEPWSRGVGRETRAIYFKNNNEGQRMRAYYLMKQFGNHAPAGSHYIATDTTGLAHVETMAFRNDNKIIVWVMNSNESEHLDTTIHLNGEELGNATIERVAWFEGSAPEGQQTSLNKNTETSIVTDINARAVVSYVITLPQPQVVGDINNDGAINRTDITTFMTVYGLSRNDEGYLASADLDNDGVITRRDYSQLYAIYRQQ